MYPIFSGKLIGHELRIGENYCATPTSEISQHVYQGPIFGLIICEPVYPPDSLLFFVLAYPSETRTLPVNISTCAIDIKYFFCRLHLCSPFLLARSDQDRNAFFEIASKPGLYKRTVSPVRGSTYAV